MPHLRSTVKVWIMMNQQKKLVYTACNALQETVCDQAVAISTGAVTAALPSLLPPEQTLVQKLSAPTMLRTAAALQCPHQAVKYCIAGVCNVLAPYQLCTMHLLPASTPHSCWHSACSSSHTILPANCCTRRAFKLSVCMIFHVSKPSRPQMASCICATSTLL